MDKTAIKKELLEHCLAFISQRIDVAQKAMDDAQESANEEGKSSMGDKHETSRSRLQQQRNQNARQLNEAINVRLVLNLLDPEKEYDAAALGSVVITKLANYFISISAGRIYAGDQKFYAISRDAPLAKVMLGKQAGEVVYFNDKPVEILEVY